MVSRKLILLITIVLVVLTSAFPAKAQSEWRASEKKDDIETFYRVEKVGTDSFEVTIRIDNNRPKAVKVITAVQYRNQSGFADGVIIPRSPSYSSNGQCTLAAVPSNKSLLCEPVAVKAKKITGVKIVRWENADTRPTPKEPPLPPPRIPRPSERIDETSPGRDSLKRQSRVSWKDLPLVKGNAVLRPDTVVFGEKYPDSFYSPDEVVAFRTAQKYKTLIMLVGVQDNPGARGGKHFQIKNEKGVIREEEALPNRRPISIEIDISDSDVIGFTNYEINGEPKEFIRYMEIYFIPK
jgi:hypothetical protein